MHQISFSMTCIVLATRLLRIAWRTYFERNFENCIYVHMDIEKKKTSTFVKTKRVAPRGHALLILLFFQSKRCVHNEGRDLYRYLAQKCF